MPKQKMSWATTVAKDDQLRSLSKSSGNTKHAAAEVLAWRIINTVSWYRKRGWVVSYLDRQPRKFELSDIRNMCHEMLDRDNLRGCETGGKPKEHVRRKAIEFLADIRGKVTKQIRIKQQVLLRIRRRRVQRLRIPEEDDGTGKRDEAGGDDMKWDATKPMDLHGGLAIGQMQLRERSCSDSRVQAMAQAASEGADIILLSGTMASDEWEGECLKPMRFLDGGLLAVFTNRVAILNAPDKMSKPRVVKSTQDTLTVAYDEEKLITSVSYLWPYGAGPEFRKQLVDMKEHLTEIEKQGKYRVVLGGDWNVTLSFASTGDGKKESLIREVLGDRYFDPTPRVMKAPTPTFRNENTKGTMPDTWAINASAMQRMVRMENEPFFRGYRKSCKRGKMKKAREKMKKLWRNRPGTWRFK